MPYKASLKKPGLINGEGARTEQVVKAVYGLVEGEKRLAVATTASIFVLLLSTGDPR